MLPIKNLFFNCYLAAQRPALGHSQGDSLTDSMLITAFFIYAEPKVTGSLVTRPSAQRGLNQKPSDSNHNALIHQATLPCLDNLLNNKILVPSHQKKLRYNGENKMLLLNSFSFRSKSNNTRATVVELNLNIPVINHVTLGNKSHEVLKLKYRTLYHNHVKSAENFEIFTK